MNTIYMSESSKQNLTRPSLEIESNEGDEGDAEDDFSVTRYPFLGTA